jgi:uncharacterized protein (TIGR02996 family)
MSDDKALLAAIWANPLEDTPRLMYADFLQETEEQVNIARAEFIRIQCELARLDEWDDSPRIATLKAREAQLWQLHRKAWLEKVSKKLPHTSFRRGFVYPRRQRFPGAQFLKLKPKEFDDAPQWDISLTGLYRNFDKVFVSPLLVSVNTLMIDLIKYPSDAIAKLAGNERLRNVEDLDLKSPAHITAEGVTAFFDGPVAVTRLRFGHAITSATVLALSKTHTAAKLRHLQLYLADLDRAAGPLFSAERFPQLRTLDLGGRVIVSHTRLTGDVVEMLFSSNSRTQLRRLALNGCALGDAAIERLAAWPGLAQIRWMDLNFNTFRKKGYLALARSPHAGNLKYLRVDEYWLRDLPKVKAELDARFGEAIDYR